MTSSASLNIFAWATFRGMPSSTSVSVTGMKPPRLRAVFKALPPQLDGEFVRHQLAAAGVFQKNFSERHLGAQAAENVAAGAMKKTGDRAQRPAMRALAGAGRAKHQNGSIVHVRLCLS